MLVGPLGSSLVLKVVVNMRCLLQYTVSCTLMSCCAGLHVFAQIRTIEHKTAYIRQFFTVEIIVM